MAVKSYPTDGRPCGRCHERPRRGKNYCLQCQRAIRKKYYSEHRSEELTRRRENYYADVELSRAKGRERWKLNAERLRANERRKYRRHRSKYKARMREYYRQNREKVLARQRAYDRRRPDAVLSARLSRNGLCECEGGKKIAGLGCCVGCAWLDGADNADAIVIAVLRGMGGAATIDAIQAEMDPASDRKVVQREHRAVTETAGYRRALRSLQGLVRSGRVVVREEDCAGVSGKSEQVRNVYVLVDNRRGPKRIDPPQRKTRTA